MLRGLPSERALSAELASAAVFVVDEGWKLEEVWQRGPIILYDP